MKICYIISDIDKAVYFEHTALSLMSKKLDVCYILINSTNGKLHRFLLDNNLTVHTIEIKSLFNSHKSIRKCKKILKELSITHVHCHLAYANWVGLWAAKLAGIKHRIYTRHSGQPLNLHWKERIIDKFQNYLATKIVSISENIDDLLKKQGVPDSKRVLIHHGFDLNRFSNQHSEELKRLKKQYNPLDKGPVIGVIARWMKWKGIQYTIGAFEKLLKDYPDAQLYLFGASDNADYSFELTQQLKQIPEQNLRIVSFENNVFDLYHLFDIYVHVPINPSCEAFGQTYVEALATGTPSVFTLSGVAREFILHEENALIVPFQDSDAIYNSIIQLLENPLLREKLITNGLESVQRLFSFEAYILNLQQLYAS